MIDEMQEIEVVVAHSERVTLRVGEVFLKIDTDQARIDREVEVMARAPIPTPRSCGASRRYWRSLRFPERRSACFKSPRPRLRRRGLRRAPPSAPCTTRLRRRGPVASVSSNPLAAAGARLSSRRNSTRSASGSSPTVSCPPTSSCAIVRSRRRRCGRGHRCSSTATCRSSTCSSTVTR